MKLENNEIANLSWELIKAEDNFVPIDPFTKRIPEITIPDAYAIQLKTIETRVKNGARVIGKKIGLTNKTLQDSYNVNEPNFGNILNTGVFSESQPIHINRLSRPRIEGEICFVLDKDLKGPGITAPDVLAATAGVIPAFEIVDSRFNQPKIKIQDAISDNSSNAGIILGSRLSSILDLDLRLIGMVMEKDGEVLGTACGAAVSGHPIQAVIWLVNKLGEFGLSLHAGQIVMSGSLLSPLSVETGTYFRATFDRIGSVSAHFIG